MPAPNLSATGTSPPGTAIAQLAGETFLRMQRALDAISSGQLIVQVAKNADARVGFEFSPDFTRCTLWLPGPDKKDGKGGVDVSKLAAQRAAFCDPANPSQTIYLNIVYLPD